MIIGMIINSEILASIKRLLFTFGDHIDCGLNRDIYLSNIRGYLKLDLILLLFIELYILIGLWYSDIVDFIHCLESHLGLL